MFKLSQYLVIDKPMDRLTFFRQSVILLLVQIICVLIYAFIHFQIVTPILFLALFVFFLIFVEFPILYLYFIMSSKRIWSAFGIRISTLLYCPIFIISIPLIFLLIIEYFLLLILPEKSE